MQRLLYIVFTLSCNQLPGATFQESWDHARSIMLRGDLAQASALLLHMEREFGEEPMFQRASFQMRFRPALAYCLMAVDNPESAVPHLQAYRAMDPPRRQLGWVDFSLSRIAHAVGDLEDAIHLYQQFAEEYPNLTEHWLALVFAAEASVEKGDTKGGIARYRQIASDPGAPGFVRRHCALTGARMLIQCGDLTQAVMLISSQDWSIGEFPERLDLTYLSLQLLEELRVERLWEAALETGQWILPHDLLWTQYPPYLADLEQRWSQMRTHWARNAPIWTNYVERRIANARAWFGNARSLPCYTAQWLISTSSCLLAQQAGWGARGMLQFAARYAKTGAEEERTIDHLWILALLETADWSAASEAARDYIERWPGDDRTPDILFAIANGWHRRGNTDLAIDELRLLLRSHPGHRSMPSWYLHAGKWNAELGFHDEALHYFDRLVRAYPDHPLALVGLYLSAEFTLLSGNTPASVRFTDELDARTPDGHGLRPYVQWLRIRHVSAPDGVDELMAKARQFDDAFEWHALRADVWNYCGDILAEVGRHTEALQCWSSVTHDAETPWQHAVFRRIETHFRLHHPEKSYEILIHYLHWYQQESAVPPRARDSISWLLRLRGHPPARDRMASDIGDLVLSWRESMSLDDGWLLITLLRELRDGLSDDGQCSWILAATDEAMYSGELTWWSRLRMYSLVTQPVTEAYREGVLLELAMLVPKEKLDARGLFQVGKTLMESGFPESGEYLRALLSRFPHCDWVPESLNLLGGDLRNRDPVEAKRYWERLIHQFSGHPAANEGRIGLAWLGLAEEDFADARSLAQQLISERTVPPAIKAEAWLILSNVAKHEMNWREARHCLRRILNLFGGFEQTVFAAVKLLEVVDEHDPPEQNPGLVKRITPESNPNIHPTRAGYP